MTFIYIDVTSMYKNDLFSNFIIFIIYWYNIKMNRLDLHRNNSVGLQRKPNSKHKTHEVQNMSGEGIFSSIGTKVADKFLNVRPKVLDDIFKTDGTVEIVKIEVCRIPIYSVFRKLLNFLSFGRLNREMKKYNYDQLFHLYMILHLANGKIYSIEKNQRIKVIKGEKKDEGSVCEGEVYSGKTLEEFVTAPEKNDFENLYRYDPFLYNCQNWVKRTFNANGITKYDSFIMQKVSTLVPSLMKKISKGITDVAGVFDYAMHGGAEGDQFNIEEDLMSRY